MSEPLTTQTVLDYIRGSAEGVAHFGSTEGLRAEALTEGNVNLIFRVTNGHRSLLIKQALPHSWRYPDFKMPVDRAGLEYDVLQLETRWAPEHTVRVYWHDEARHLNAIEDLDQHIVLRAGLIAGREYPNLARHIGRFMAQTLFHTSDLYLPSAEKKHLVQRFTNPVMCKVQEDLVFTQPFTRHPNNRWNPRLDQQVAALHANAALISEVHSLKQAYLAHAQALLHNDLHSGSVLVNAVETRVIDPEFAFFGPIGHDVGSYLANLVLNYAGHEHHSALGATRARYRSWLLEQIRETWTTFEAEFLRLWETEGNAIEWPEPTYRARYLRDVLRDTAGFGATEIVRRTIGLAHVADLDEIPNDEDRASAESLALNVAVAWLTMRPTLTDIHQLVSLTETARPDLAPSR